MYIPTADEFTKKLLTEIANCRGIRVQSAVVSEAFIEFAKLHCDAQSNAILENAYIDNNSVQGCCMSDDDFTINKESILNAYPLTNIK
jgi:hypothetical protein